MARFYYIPAFVATLSTIILTAGCKQEQKRVDLEQNEVLLLEKITDAEFKESLKNNTPLEAYLVDPIAQTVGDEGYKVLAKNESITLDQGRKLAEILNSPETYRQDDASIVSYSSFLPDIQIIYDDYIVSIDFKSGEMEIETADPEQGLYYELEKQNPQLLNWALSVFPHNKNLMRLKHE